MRRTVSSHRRKGTRRDMAACEGRGGQWAAGPPLSVGQLPTRTRTPRVRSSAVATAPTRAATHVATLSHSEASGAAWGMSVSRETASAPHDGYVGATRPPCSGSSELSPRRHERRTSIDNPSASRSCTRPENNSRIGTPRRAETAHPDRRQQGRETQCSGCSAPRTPSLTRRGHHGQRGAQLSAQFTCLTRTRAARRTRRETHSAQRTTTDGARREPRAAS